MTNKVFTHYDSNKTVIGTIRPNNGTISERTYKNLLKKRTVGGDAGIYTDSETEIRVIDKNGYVIATI